MIIGASSGGLKALKTILDNLKIINFPIIVVLHRMAIINDNLISLLKAGAINNVIEVFDKMPLEAGNIYVAPSNYHLLIERDLTFSLSTSEEVNYSRPSIDVTLFSTAEIFEEKAVGIILTGANEDGARGLDYLYHKGGTAIVQDPDEAQVSIMPEYALSFTPRARKMKLSEIAAYLSDYDKN